MNFDTNVESLKRNTLEIDGINMTLTQSVSVNPITYEGSGYIRQDSTGSLNFKIYVSTVRNTDIAQNLMKSFQVESGKLYEESEFYALKVRTADSIWVADRILPSLQWTMGTCTLVQGKLRSISAETLLRKSEHSISLRYFDDMELPIAFGRSDTDRKKMGKAEFETNCAKITVEELPDETVFTATAAVALDDAFHTRMDEALRFLTAKSVEWRVLVRQTDQKRIVELTSGSRRSITTRLDPPITRGVQGYWDHGWLLFAAYLEYSLKNTNHAYWNHCTAHLHNACEASANSLDAWGLGLSVAVDGIAEIIPYQQNTAEKKLLRELRDSIIKHIHSKEEFRAYEKRLNGLLCSMGNIRLQDRVDSLVAAGYFSPHYAKAWSTLRNKSAHPKQIDPQRMDSNEIQSMFDLINKTTTFMYQIVFYLIGY